MMQKRLRQCGFCCQNFKRGEMECPPFYNAFKKILSRGLGAIPYRPGAGGIQNVGQNPEEQSVNITLTFIDEQSINTPVFCS
jgi:hypothetical protein